MTDTDDNLTTIQELSLEDSQNIDQEIDDQESMRSVHHGRSVSDVIDDYNEKSVNYSNQWCGITLLPRIVINEQSLVPIETCTRLIGFKQAIEQDEQREEAQRNYVPSPVLTEAELYLRLETIWWLDKITGAVSAYATRKKVKESDDQPGGADALDFDHEDTPDGAYVFDSSDADDLDNELLGDGENLSDEPKGKEVRCELYKTIKGRKYNSKQVRLCWYYE